MNDKPFNDYSYEQFLQESKIMGSSCNQCGALALPPRSICCSCSSNEMEWVQFKGAGKLLSFTSIVVAPPRMVQEGFNRSKPYVVGVVELDEGVKVVARLVEVDAKKPELIKIGLPLNARFILQGGEKNKQIVLAFEPVEKSSQ